MAWDKIVMYVLAGAGLAKTGEVVIGDPSTEIAKVSDDNIVVGAEAVVPVAAKGSNGSRSGYIKKTDYDQLATQTVTIPQNFAGLEAVMVPTRLQEQLFRIIEVVEDEDCVTITARHVWYDNINNQTYWKADAETKYSAGDLSRNILANTVSPANTRVATDCTDEIIGKDLDYERKNLVECFLDPENGICKKYGLSMIRNNWDCYILKNVGYDRGLVIQNKKNLLGVERTESIENVVTRIAPIAKDEKGEIIWLDNDGAWYVDSQYINDYSYPRSIILDTGLQVGKDDTTAENVQDKLLAAAQKEFNENKVDLPEVNMTIEFLSLGDTEEYVQYRDLDKVYLYDILTLVDTVRGYSYTAQVIAVEHDLLTGMLNSVTIGNLENWDGKRKIATWQVPEIDGSNIRLKSIMAGSFEIGAILGDDLAENIIEYAHFKSATIDALTADSIDAVTARIHEIIAGSITADDITTGSLTADVIAANAITTDKLAAEAITTEKLDAGAVTAAKIAAGAVTTAALDAYAVTADKLAAGAVTADKIDANAITADKLSATDIDAINAKLGTATIAQAEIETADINFAHIKDLNAQSAYFGQAIFDEAVGGKLYVPRLAVGYAQMIGATIGDLVIQASNGSFYGIDVDLNGDVIATQRTVTSEEIASGHTTDGRTLVLGTDILATDLNTENIYASHALMNEITAAIINVDQLWARDAFIGKLMTTDISSNTYIQATIGTWSSGTTITQTINSLVSHVQQMGYANIYYSSTEPDHNNLVEGDIWIQPQDENEWQDIDDLTWNYLNNNMTWEEVYGAYTMYAWNGNAWRKMYDSTVTRDLSTQIDQNAAAIALKANQTDVNLLSGRISEFGAELTIQSQQIQSAVSSVNAKTAMYAQWADPSLTETLTTGDQWLRTQMVFKFWKDPDDAPTWQTVKGYKWEDALGDKSYVWNGSEWILTTDRAMELYHGTQILETAEAIALEAEARLAVENLLWQIGARLTVTNSSIEQEVWRATNAEGGKIDKTSRLQTADAIVQEAVRTSSAEAYGSFIQKTTIYQDAESIVQAAVEESASAANGIYLKKTTNYQTADAIVAEAVRQAKSDTNTNYLKKTTTYQSADQIYSQAVSASGAAATRLANDAETNAKTAAQGYANSAENNAKTAAQGYANSAENNAKTAAQGYANNARDAAISACLPKTTGYSSIDDIIDEAEELANNARDSAIGNCISKTALYQSADTIVAAATKYTDDNAYAIVSGVSITAYGVKVTGNRYVYLDVSATNYIHIDSDGITMVGSRVRVNGNDMWARDDIVIMNPNSGDSWRRSVSTIESHMSGKHDWVLIRPFYDASISYVGNTGHATADTVYAYWFTESGSSGKAFGGQADWYNYSISLNLRNDFTQYRDLRVQVFLSNTPFSFIPGSSNWKEQAASQANVILSETTGTIAANGGTLSLSMSSGHVGYNLCAESTWVYYYIHGIGYESMEVTGISMTATTDTTNGRVPCTTYYYP